MSLISKSQTVSIKGFNTHNNNKKENKPVIFNIIQAGIHQKPFFNTLNY